MLQITEDTPPDMLAGTMDLMVQLPTGRSVKMSVERSTPMMDLLVQITTNYQLQLSQYTLQVLAMIPSKDNFNNNLPYKPNTPIGTLDTQCIQVVPKTRNMSVSKNPGSGHQPFESTFRLKVHLPRNQLFVTRVSQSVCLENIMKKVCEEKNLNPLKYEFRHPENLDKVLDPKLSLSDYAITEIYIVQKGTGSLNRTFSTNDIMALRKEEERKQMHNKTGGGVFNLIFRRGKSSTGSLSSENRSISPTHSDDSRSVTPPAVQPVDRPKPPQRKRKPAPKPPADNTNRKSENGLPISHSRNSSDSSGYHEASVLSDNCNTSLPRRPKSTVIGEESISNLNKLSIHSKSTSNLSVPNRRKKSAPPPPPAPVLKPENRTNLEEPSPVVASQPCKVAQTESTVSANQPAPLDSLTSQTDLPATIEEPFETEDPKVEEISVKDEVDIIPVLNQQSTEPTPVSGKDPDPKIELETDWQYQLPSPPKAFRDSSPEPVRDNLKTDSIITPNELFEKLKVIENSQQENKIANDAVSTISEEEKPILNTLSLENLEKRKSLVYNRELATSLKMTDTVNKPETFSSSLMKFEKTYDDVKKSSPKQSSSMSTLPNFKITTYNPKEKLDIFEDDTISSNSDIKRNSVTEPGFPIQRSYIGHSMENLRKHDTAYNFTRHEITRNQNVTRSDSFTKEQTWVPSKPVVRSKSQLILNKNSDSRRTSQIEEENLVKSNSLFDVSGLQSLEVMRLIQNKLNTPNQETSYRKEEEELKSIPQEKPVIKTYKYSPPSINMGTWSERPKVPVNVKEDPDYKFGVKETNSKIVVSTYNNNLRSQNSIEVKNNNSNSFTNGSHVKVANEATNKNVSIKVNGFEPVSHNSGNVVIKIGGPNSPVFRKPLGGLNSERQRPHSVAFSNAFSNEFDISRLPVVRSVEFKKSAQTTPSHNTSITQIYADDQINKPVEEPPKAKPVFRANSFLQHIQTPVVRGFQNQPQSSSTLPLKPAKRFLLNAPVPFSQPNLRKTEIAESKIAPPAPQLPKFTYSKRREVRETGVDAKEQLLQAIRDFGGKKGLKAVKA